MTDAEYDRTLLQLQTLEKAHPELSRLDSPTQRIGGAPSTGFKSYPMVPQMKSLDKIYDNKELETRLTDWFQQGVTAVAIEPKVDGVSVELRYEEGRLVQALNRGPNGETGNDITANVKTIKSIPLKLVKDEPVFRIRGEIFMTFKDFRILNDQLKLRELPAMKNPRNAASGAVQLLDPKLTAARRLSFIPYNVVEGLDELNKQDEVLEYFTHLGFMQMPAVTFATNVEDAIEAVNKFEAVRAHLFMPTDGCVIKIADLKQRKLFPDATRTIRWGYAYKYAPEEVETTVTAIRVQVGRTGALTPVADVAPVDVDGSTISNASIHNENEVVRLDVRVGDTVMIAKAGYIIPEIQSVVLERRPANSVPFRMPDFCPTCKSPAVKRVLEDDALSVKRYCSNDKCPDILKASIGHWCGKEAMDIEGAGDALLDILVDKVGITQIYDLYNEELESDLLKAGVGAGITANFITAINASRSRGMENVLVGLGVERVGRTLSRKLARLYPDISAVLASPDEVLSKHMGEADLKAWKEAYDKTLSLVGHLCAAEVDITSKTYSPEAANGILAGKTIVITGTLVTMGRDEAQRKAEALGAKCTGSVSKKTSFLVVGDEPGKNKTDAAKKHNITMLTEEQFLELIEEV